VLNNNKYSGKACYNGKKIAPGVSKKNPWVFKKTPWVFFSRELPLGFLPPGVFSAAGRPPENFWNFF